MENRILALESIYIDFTNKISDFKNEIEIIKSSNYEIEMGAKRKKILSSDNDKNTNNSFETQIYSLQTICNNMCTEVLALRKKIDNLRSTRYKQKKIADNDNKKVGSKRKTREDSSNNNNDANNADINSSNYYVDNNDNVIDINNHGSSTSDNNGLIQNLITTAIADQQKNEVEMTNKDIKVGIMKKKETKPPGFWNKERCQEEALKYPTKTKFRESASTAYRTSRVNGWINDVCSHMITNINNDYKVRKTPFPRGYWTKEKCQEIAIQCKKRSEFAKFSESAYDFCKRHKIMDEICSHMPEHQKERGHWTQERCAEEALKYETRTKFCELSGSAYRISTKNNWLDEVCSHMRDAQTGEVKRKPKGYWSKDRCREEALKFNTRKQFQNNSVSAYDCCKKNKWLTELCSHM